MELRPFEDSDWNCYAGCEDENPLIGTEEYKMTLDGYTFFFDVIVDKFTVSLELFCEDLVEKSHSILCENVTITKECMARKLAIVDAKSIQNNPTPEWLLLNGFHLL